MKKQRLAVGLFVWLLSAGSVLAQHLGMGQVLELFNAPLGRRGQVLKANNFQYRGAYTVAQVACYRYGRMQADLDGDEYEETVDYCATGSLTYTTHSPTHATILKLQLTQTLGFQDKGPFTSGSGLLKNGYQRRNLRVETTNTKDSQREDIWLFQCYEEKLAPMLAQLPPAPPDPVRVGTGGTLPSGSLRGNFYALLIGVNDYTDRRLPDLTFPAQDAERLGHTLTAMYSFPQRNITMLINPTRKTILRAFDDLTYRLRKEDNLLLFFAGHGRQQAGSQQGYWLPADAQNDYEDDWLSNSTIRDQLRRFACRHVLVVSDACFSGELISARGVSSTSADPSTAIQQLYALRSRRAITSAGSTPVPDRSVFIDYLIRRLTENTRPYLTASELFVSMREAVINNSSLKQVPMYGYIQQAGDEGGDFIFVRQP